MKIAVLGAGSWGTALALVGAKAGHEVTLWGRNESQMADMAASQENAAYLPGITLDSALTLETDFGQAIAGAELILLVVPMKALRRLLEMIGAEGGAAPVVLCCKGLEQESLLLPSQIAKEVLPKRAALTLSGPSFAREVARGLPTALTLAGEDKALAKSLSEALSIKGFRLYHSADVVGVELAGALKNVVAIACGIVEAQNFGENARSALITRGLAEIARLGEVLGANPITFMGLSGLGDLTLSCASESSRNFRLGLALGKGTSLADFLAETGIVVEGASSALAARDLVRKLEVEAPIIEAVATILEDHSQMDAVISGLLSRPVKAEVH